MSPTWATVSLVALWGAAGCAAAAHPAVRTVPRRVPLWAVALAVLWAAGYLAAIVWIATSVGG